MTTTPKTPAPEAQMQHLLAELDDWFLSLKRAAVGFNALRIGFLTATKQLPEGERPKGLPIFEFNGALNGRESVDKVKIVADVKHIPTEYLGHVLVPLINMFAGQVLEAIEEIGKRVTVLQPLIQSIVNPIPTDQAAPA